VGLSTLWKYYELLQLSIQLIVFLTNKVVMPEVLQALYSMVISPIATATGPIMANGDGSYAGGLAAADV